MYAKSPHGEWDKLREAKKHSFETNLFLTNKWGMAILFQQNYGQIEKYLRYIGVPQICSDYFFDDYKMMTGNDIIRLQSRIVIWHHRS